MWSKSIYRLTNLTLLLLAIATSAWSASDSILIVYPKPGQTMGSTDSAFVIGSVPKSIILKNRNLIVRVNGMPFDVHPEGGFIGFVPLKPGEFSFDVTAHEKPPVGAKKHTKVLAKGSVKVKVTQPPLPVSPDTLRIVGDYQPPRGDLAISAGDILEVSCLATPGSVAWFSIPGVADSIPMTESPSRSQGYWGDALFGEGQITDSSDPQGVYSGIYRVRESNRGDSIRIRYFLSKRDAKAVDSTQRLSSKAMVVKDSSDYRITFNSPAFPFTVRTKDSIIVIRHGIQQGYLAAFQPRGLELLVVGAEGDWYKVLLSQTQYGWVNAAQVERMQNGVLPPHSFIKSMRQFSYPDSVVFQIPVSGLHPFRSFEDDRRTLRVQLFGVTSNTDWIRYDNRDSLVDFARWYQPEEGLYELTLSLNQNIWGYDCYFANGNFCIKLNRPPHGLENLKGKRIVIDPGHSKDPGSTGPSGYTEAEANLAIAKDVRDALIAKGAEVVMTRNDMRDVPLADRPVIAKRNNADLFVSIHNNALPDGVNPFATFGTASFYYNIHSIDLARAIHAEMLKETGLPDYGIYYGNLAVIRPTEYPAVLVECAFMMLPDQEALIKSDKFRKQVARAVTAGIEKFCKEFDHGR
jgi:N-acetylmuramoyl-L-alanine amidase